jgi:hypothetical protein
MCGDGTPSVNEHSQAYNIDMSAAVKTYCEKDLEEKNAHDGDGFNERKTNCHPIKFAADMLERQQQHRKLIKTHLDDKYKWILSKYNQTKIYLEWETKNFEYLTRLMVKNPSLAAGADSYQTESAEILSSLRKEFAALERELALVRKDIQVVDNLFRMSAEHDLAKRIFKPYGDPKSSAKIDSCLALYPSP